MALRKNSPMGRSWPILITIGGIDIIPFSETADINRCLATFINIQVESRDRASIYSSLATASHLGTIQVSDRFHLIKGLSDAINKYIIREFPTKVAIPLAEAVS